MLRKIISVIAYLLPVIVTGQTIIECNRSDFKNTTITFLTEDNPFTHHERIIGECISDQNGSFKCNLNIKKTQLIHTRIQALHLSLFAETNRKYQVILPPSRQKTKADELNPFFTEERFPIGIEVATNLTTSNRILETEELNYKIFIIDSIYSHFVDKASLNVYRNLKAKADSVITEMNTRFLKKEKNEFLLSYLHNKQILIKQIYQKLPVSKAAEQYFSNQSLQIENPAFIELFNSIFDKLFFNLSKTDLIQALSIAVYSDRQPNNLMQFLRSNFGIKDSSLQTLIILKSIYDDQFSKTFEIKRHLELLDSIILKSPPPFSTIAKEIRFDIARIMTGEKPPTFILLTKDSIYQILSDFYGRYVYMHFCSPENYTCLKEYRILNEYHRRFGNKVIIISMFVDSSFSEMKHFVKSNKYDWLFLYSGNNSELLYNYNIQAYPSCLFLGPDGRIILSSAPSATEGIERKIYEIMKKNGAIEGDGSEAGFF